MCLSYVVAVAIVIGSPQSKYQLDPIKFSIQNLNKNI